MLTWQVMCLPIGQECAVKQGLGFWQDMLYHLRGQNLFGGNIGVRLVTSTLQCRKEGTANANDDATKWLASNSKILKQNDVEQRHCLSIQCVHSLFKGQLVLSLASTSAATVLDHCHGVTEYQFITHFQILYEWLMHIFCHRHIKPHGIHKAPCDRYCIGVHKARRHTHTHANRSKSGFTQALLFVAFTPRKVRDDRASIISADTSVSMIKQVSCPWSAHHPGEEDDGRWRVTEQPVEGAPGDCGDRRCQTETAACVAPLAPLPLVKSRNFGKKPTVYYSIISSQRDRWFDLRVPELYPPRSPTVQGFFLSSRWCRRQWAIWRSQSDKCFCSLAFSPCVRGLCVCSLLFNHLSGIMFSHMRRVLGKTKTKNAQQQRDKGCF